MTGPATPEQAPQMAPKKNTGLSIVTVLVFAFIGMPIILTIAAFIFVTINFDKITAWIDSHMTEGAYTLNIEQRESAENIYIAANSAHGEKTSIKRQDCYNMQKIAESNNNYFMVDGYCDADEIKVAGRPNNDMSRSIFMESDNGRCIEFVFESDYKYFTSYRSTTNGCDVREMTIVQLDGDKEEKKLEESAQKS